MKTNKQVTHINLYNTRDPSAILEKEDNSLTIVSDPHSYSKHDRVFPINQDENTVFSGYVYQDSKKTKPKSVLDLCTGSGVIAMAAAKAGSEVIATDINRRCKEFVEKNNEINKVSVEFKESDIFENISGKFDKITMNPPFMPSPDGIFPLHAQGGSFGTENVLEPFFKQVWTHVKNGGCIQIIVHSFANDEYDTVLSLLDGNLPKGWSYEIKHVFPIKDVPIELYTTSFVEHKNYSEWMRKIENKNLKYMRFYMLTIRNNGKDGLQEEEVSEPRLYNIIHIPSTLNHLAKNLEMKHLEKPISEKEFPMIGHLMRLSRYNYLIYSILFNLFP